MLSNFDNKSIEGYPTIDELLATAQSNTSDSVDAQYILGTLYLEGKMGAPKDLGQGISWLRGAAEAGEVNAQCLLGSIYAEGKESIQKDVVKGLYWLNKAASQGNDTAKLILGCIYAGAKDVVPQDLEQDLEQAIHWLEQAQRSQNAEAVVPVEAMTGGFDALRSSQDALQQQSGSEQGQYNRQRNTQP